MGHLLFRCSLLLISLLIILHSLEGAVELSNFLPYGLSAGDTRVPTGDDNSAGPISFRLPFPFFEKRETIAFVNTNGAVSFGRAINQFTPTCGPMDDMSRMVAPFWADVDTRRGGDIYYRESNDPYLLELVSREVAAAFPQLWGVEIKWLFITTWLEVAYYGCCSGCLDTQRRNNYQSILATDGTTSFAILYFNKITWTTGTASGGNGCGLGGVPAKVGFDPGDGVNFYSVPQSCTDSILYITSMSNLPNASPGKFVFRVDNANSIRGCINDRDPSLVPLTASPAYVDFMGNRPVVLSGPCFNHSAEVNCTFVDPSGQAILVPGKIMPESTVGKAVCAAPYFKRTGRTRVQLSLYEPNTTNVFNESTTLFNGSLSISHEEPSLSVKLTRYPSSVELSFSWSPSLFNVLGFNSSARSVSIRMIVFETATSSWKDALIVFPSIPNVAAVVNTTLQFGNITWLLPPDTVSKSFVAFRVDVTEPASDDVFPNTYKFNTGFSSFFCGSLFFLPSQAERDKQCTSWYRSQPTPPRDLPVCPPLLQQALQDWRFEREPIGTIMRPNAAWSFRSRVPQENNSYSQQCTYNAAGRLIVGPIDGGNARFAHPLIDPINHWKSDVVPFCDCCLELRLDRCVLYYQKRPSDPGVGYRPPNLIGGSGDPHFTSLDGVQYTFNPIGEFHLIKQILPSGAHFEVQARTEKYEPPPGSNETSRGASIFTAFAMRRTDPGNSSPAKTIQVQRSGRNNGLEILIDGTLLPLESVMSRSQRVDNFVVDGFSFENNLRLRVVFDAGWALEFSSMQGAMSYMVAASEGNKNTPRGLLGNFNGIQNDDLTTPDGQQIQIDSPLQDVHYKFGMSWNVSASESIFFYPPGRNHSFYQNSSFTPSFYKPTINDVPPQAAKMCHDSLACLYDFVSTGGNIAIANNTVRSEERVKNITATLNVTVVMCPKHNISSYAVIQTTNGYFDGSIVSLICSNDSKLEGNKEATCSDGRWNVPLGNCIPLDSPIDPPTTLKPPPVTQPPVTQPPKTPSPIEPEDDSGFNLFKPPFLYAFIGVLALAVVVIVAPVAVVISRKVNKVGAAEEADRQNNAPRNTPMGGTAQQKASNIPVVGTADGENVELNIISNEQVAGTSSGSI